MVLLYDPLHPDRLRPLLVGAGITGLVLTALLTRSFRRAGIGVARRDPVPLADVP